MVARLEIFRDSVKTRTGASANASHSALAACTAYVQGSAGLGARCRTDVDSVALLSEQAEISSGLSLGRQLAQREHDRRLHPEE